MSDSFSSDSEELIFGFGWNRAIIQECLVVIVINGTIAWFVFRGRTDIVWLGWGGIYSLLFPMSMILSLFGSFFCYRLGWDIANQAMVMLQGLKLGDSIWPR